MKNNVSVRILDYGVGNLHSVYRACKIYAEDVKVVKDLSGIDSVSHLVLPGVGAFGVAMKSINEVGLGDQIKEFIDSGNPLLGICVGMQILGEVGFENGIHKGLGILEGRVVSLSDCCSTNETRVPNMGWSSVTKTELNDEGVLLRGLQDSFYAYFAHSYTVEMRFSDYVSGYVQFPSTRITATVEKKNVFGVQFHPEKSGVMGLKIIENFLNFEK